MEVERKDALKLKKKKQPTGLKKEVGFAREKEEYVEAYDANDATAGERKPRGFYTSTRVLD